MSPSDLQVGRLKLKIKPGVSGNLTCSFLSLSESLLVVEGATSWEEPEREGRSQSRLLHLSIYSETRGLCTVRDKILAVPLLFKAPYANPKPVHLIPHSFLKITHHRHRLAIKFVCKKKDRAEVAHLVSNGLKTATPDSKYSLAALRGYWARRRPLHDAFIHEKNDFFYPLVQVILRGRDAWQTVSRRRYTYRQCGGLLDFFPLKTVPEELKESQNIPKGFPGIGTPEVFEGHMKIQPL